MVDRDLQPRIVFNGHYVTSVFPEFRETGMRELQLEEYDIRKDGVVELVKLLKNTDIDSLELRNCCVETGVMSILMEKIKNTATSLVLDFPMSLSKDDVSTIFDNLKNSKITHLEISPEIYEWNNTDIGDLLSGLYKSNVINLKIIVPTIIYRLESFALLISKFRVELLLQHLINNLKYTKVESFSYKMLRPLHFEPYFSFNFDELKYTNITEFSWKSVHLIDESMISLFKVLPETKISKLKLLFLGRYDSINKSEILRFVSNSLKHNTNLKWLQIENYLTDNRRFVRAIKNTKIEYLNLSYNRLNIELVQELMTNLEKTRIKYLDISNNNIESNDINRLCSFLPISSTVKIDLGLIEFSDAEALTEIFKNKNLHNITFIPKFSNLDGNFVRHLMNLNLKKLSISQCHFKDSEFFNLIDFLKNSNILSLEFKNCMLQPEQIKMFADCLQYLNIHYLYFNDFEIDDEKLECFFYQLKNTQLVAFTIGGTRILSEKYVNKLLPNIKNTHITHLNSIFDIWDTSLKNLDFSYAQRGPVYKCLYENWNRAKKFLYAFKTTIIINENHELEFSEIDSHIEKCLFLIKTLEQFPLIISHLFYDESVFFTRPQIIFFTQNISEIFENCVATKVDSVEKVVEILKAIDETNGFEDTTKRLLLHRPLYIIDHTLQILHPTMYKLLHKHNLPLYQKNLEPEKKNVIISFFLKNSSYDDAKKVIDIIKSY